MDMAVHNTPDTMELIQGLGDGEKLGAKPFLRTVITGGIQMCGVITIPGKGIEKYSDLKDKVVVLRNPGQSVVGTYCQYCVGQCRTDSERSQKLSYHD